MKRETLMKRLHFENRMHGETVFADANPLQNDERNTRTQVNRFGFFLLTIHYNFVAIKRSGSLCTIQEINK